MHISDAKYLELLRDFRSGSLPSKSVLKCIVICDAMGVEDDDVWRTTEEGKHFKFDNETGEIKAGFGGKHNGKKLGGDWKKPSESVGQKSSAEQSAPQIPQRTEVQSATLKKTANKIRNLKNEQTFIIGQDGEIRHRTEGHSIRCL